MSSVYAEAVSMGRALYPTENRGLRVLGGGLERRGLSGRSGEEGAARPG